MRTHVKVLGVLYIALGTIGIMVALFMTAMFGTVSSVVGMNSNAHDAAIALPFIGLAGSMLVAFLLIASIPGVIAGIGLLKFQPWARILAIVVAVINLIHVPIGTIVGVYGLWVLFNKETEALFEGKPLGI
jgi:hypothetical protein